jgi:hypothetical protein
MSARSDDNLAGDLHRRAAEVARPKREADLVARCLELAVATTCARPRVRARQAGGRSAETRAHDEALRALDVAARLPAEHRAELAIYTCAIAIHCDRSEHDVAVELERQVVAAGVDRKFGFACLRLYSELFAASEDEEYGVRRDSYRALVELLEAEQTVAA